MLESRAENARSSVTRASHPLTLKETGCKNHSELSTCFSLFPTEALKIERARAEDRLPAQTFGT